MFLKLIEVPIVAEIFNDYKLLIVFCVCVDKLSAGGWFPVGLFLLIVLELLLLHKLLSPSLEGDPIVWLIGAK